MPDSNRTVALVTGAAGGIGAATTAYLADAGFDVMMTDLNAERCGSLITRIAHPERVATHTLDVTDIDSIQAAVDATVARFGQLDALVNIAGVPEAGAAAEIDDDSWTRLLNIHLNGTMRCARACYPMLRASGSAAVVNMSSAAAIVGMPGRVAYSAAKSGIAGITRSLAVEWAPDNIRVNAVAPGYVRTEGFDQRMKTGSRDRIEQLMNEVPLQRFCEPVEVASVIGFLISPASTYVTGQQIAIDGAMTIRGVG